MTSPAPDTLYQKIRLDFFRKVYGGEIRPGEQLPAERRQAEELAVSRGTIRKTRKLLEEEGYISNTQGSAAVYTPLTGRFRQKGEITAALVPVHNPFFMSYYRAFEHEAEREGMLVMIKQLESGGSSGLERLLFTLFLKGIRDLVFWPYDTILDYELIERLSGLGMNIVLFDTIRENSSCDSVSVDNRHALRCLYQALKEKGADRIVYLGWDTPLLSSNRERERAFRELCGTGDLLFRLPWNQESLPLDILEESLDLEDMLGDLRVNGFLCGNGHIGIRVKELLNRMGLTEIPVVSMDNFEESRRLGLTVYEQPFEAMGRKTFEILSRRHRGEGKPEIQNMKGRLIKR